MRKPSRMIVAVVLGFGLALVAGCGSKSESPNTHTPGQPDDAKGDTQTGGDPKSAAVQATYELDPAKHAIPTGPVTGVLGGEAVTAEVRLEGRTLLLRKPLPAGDAAPGDSWQVWIELPPEAQRGEPYRLVTSVDKGPGLSIFAEFPKPVPIKQWELFSFQGWEPMKFLGWQGGCSLTLELGKREKGKLSGKVYLALGELDAKEPGHRRSYLAGSFEADCPRQPTESPGVEDVPFVNGTVKVKGASANATLRVGYASAPNDKTFPLGAAEIQIGEPIDPPRWSQSSPDPPRISSIIAGDGKEVPSRYEHSKMSQGRYLIFAQIKDGPAAWKWVTIQAQSTLAVDLTIDAAQVGGVEVTVPLGVVGSVQMAPADEPNQPAMSPELFLGIALQMKLEEKIIVRKALFKNLAPGKYEVRTGGRSRVVEIVAGKTVELDLDAPPPPDPKQ